MFDDADVLWETLEVVFIDFVFFIAGLAEQRRGFVENQVLVAV